MKKVLAILVVLALVAGFAFATDPVKTDAEGDATIEVTTDVKETFPRFGITASGITSTQGTIDTADATVAADGAVTIKTNYLTTNSVAITFTINQIENSRCTAGYKLKVKATDLVLDGYKTLGTVNVVDADEKFAVSKTTDFAAANGASITDVRTVTAVTSSETAGFTGFDGGFTVSYLNGKYIDVAADNAAKKPLGTVTYTWAKNETAVVGDYNATVELTIVAD